MPHGASDPLDRFTGLAEVYARGRPAYPEAAVTAVIDRARLGPESQLVDVGCGTGISARLFAARGVPVIGVEPNDDMRRQAEDAPALLGPRPEYRAGRAEATGLTAGVADAVLVAQAFHWFEPDAALREFHRVLKPDGWLAMIWNERDETDPFTAAFGDIIRTWPDTAAHETARAKAGDVLATYALFTDYERLTFTIGQIVDAEGLRGRAFSASYAPPDAASRAATRSAVDELFARHQRDGRVELRYVTTLHLALRRAAE
jgi:ubiquinone/menaquinone biosynthesis C-methylase UbiE